MNRGDEFLGVMKMGNSVGDIISWERCRFIRFGNYSGIGFLFIYTVGYLFFIDSVKPNRYTNLAV